ncbi:MAG: thiamine diphosphokinase, partial [Oscillospiraceae bacterium]|nr:thiamine diphosphokinase [Oscillospiraceae bacterium]
MEQKNKQLIVFLAGEIRDKQRIRSLLSNNEWDIFAADAGYKYALEFNALPKLVFGDFDSMNKPELDDLLIFPCEKDQTDSELALDLAAKHHYKKVMFIAPFGGRIDHTLANLNLLKKASGAGIDLQLYDGENLVFILPHGIHRPATTYRYISFIPMEDH